jgi:hypothetical protein
MLDEKEERPFLLYLTQIFVNRFIEKQFGTDKVTVEKVSKKTLSTLFGADFDSADFSESPFTKAAFAHQVATAFTNQGKSPYDDIRR